MERSSHHHVSTDPWSTQSLETFWIFCLKNGPKIQCVRCLGLHKDCQPDQKVIVWQFVHSNYLFIVLMPYALQELFHLLCSRAEIPRYEEEVLQPPSHESQPFIYPWDNLAHAPNDHLDSHQFSNNSKNSHLPFFSCTDYSFSDQFFYVPNEMLDPSVFSSSGRRPFRKVGHLYWVISITALPFHSPSTNSLIHVNSLLPKLCLALSEMTLYTDPRLYTINTYAFEH